MKEKETELSPCRMSKEQITEHLKGFLTDGEYIKDWTIGDDNKLLFRVFIKEKV